MSTTCEEHRNINGMDSSCQLIYTSWLQFVTDTVQSIRATDEWQSMILSSNACEGIFMRDVASNQTVRMKVNVFYHITHECMLYVYAEFKNSSRAFVFAVSETS